MYVKQNNYYLVNTNHIMETTERTRGINNVMIRNIKPIGVFIRDFVPSLFKC